MATRKRIPSELKKMVLSPRKAKRELKWKPRIDLINGIRREIDWIRSNPLAWRIKGNINV